LERPLALADFACYEEFLLAALPAETAARVAAAAQWAETAVIGGVAGRILRAAVASQRRLDGVLGRLGSLQTLAELLLIASQELAATIDSLGEVTGAACRASAGVAERAPVLASTAQAMTALGCDLHGIVAALAECLAAVRATVLRLRFGIALARLHTDMVIRFSREVHEGAAPAGGSAHIAALCEAMNDDVGRLAEQVAKSSAALRWTSEGVTRCSAQFGQFQKLLTAWRLQVPRLGLSRELEGLVEPIDRQLAQGLDQIASWRELALRCLNGVAPVDRAAFEESIHEITAALGELGTLVE
jgi:aerotaxis receptor